LDDELWSRLLQLVKLGHAKNVSQLVNQLLVDALGKLGGSGKQEDLSYEMLKKKHLSLSRELVKLEKHMKDYGSDYQVLVGLAEDFGLDFERLSNIDAVVPRLVKEWRGSRGSLHLFITMLEKAREKKQIESRLDKFRSEPS